MSSSLGLFLALFTIFATTNIAGMADQPRPPVHFRSQLAKTLYNRMVEDEEDRENDHREWYAVNTQHFSEDLCDKFIQSHQDKETKSFLENCFDKADWLFTQIYHSLARSLLSWFMTQTTVNGLLQRGSMFVFSSKQFQDLMDISPEWQADSLLDLGAGDGMVTKKMEKHFKNIYATEVSTTMKWRLEAKGYSVIGIDEWPNSTYDVISCLNLLDRCDKPMTLLKDIHKALEPETGRLIVALVLPYKPYVENASNNHHQPTEYLHPNGTSFEDQAASIVKDMFEPCGFTLLKFTRLPYLCEGDLNHSYYILHDAVFILKPT